MLHQMQIKIMDAGYKSMIPGIKGGLPAAGLIRQILQIVSKMLQDFDHSQSDIRIDLVYQTGDKQRNRSS